MMKKNKKGNWFDIFVFSMVVLILATVLSVGYIFNNQLNEKLLNVTTIDENVKAKQVVTDHQERLPFIFDFPIPALYLGLLIFSAVSARKIRSTHMLTPVTIFVSPLLIMVAMVVEVVWDKYTSGANILATTISTDLTLTNAFMDNFIIFTAIYIFIVGVSLYTKDE